MEHLALAALAASWLLDALVGDPPRFAPLHPIVWIGRLVSLCTKLLWSEKAGKASMILRGALLWALVVGASAGAAWAAQLVAAKVGELALFAVWTFLGWATIATGDLARQAGGVADLAREGKLGEARKALSMIVGRDTENLPEGEIYRAAFETAAENSSDGVVAPILFLALGFALGVGPTLAIAYKAVNTLDSMVGYKNARYLHFGRVSARIDDLANLLPARITALFAALGATILFGTGLRSLKIALRDHGHHSSPNSGYPEAAFAGAVGVRIGGTNYYGGAARASHTIGDPAAPLDCGAVRRAINLLWTVSSLALAAGALLVLTVAARSL